MKKTVVVQDRADYKSEQSYQPKPGNNGGVIAVAAAVALVIGIGGGFIAGYQIAGNKNDTNQLGQRAGLNGMVGPGQFGMGGFGTVTAVSSDSITIKDQRQGDETSYTITSNTEVTDNGDDAAVSDIKVGDTVMIRTDDSNDSASKTATSIQRNPSFGGARGNMQSSQSSDDSDSQSSI